MAQGDLVLEFLEILQSLKTYARDLFRCSGKIRGSAMRLLMFLHHHVDEDCPGIQPSELGDILKLTRPTITSLVNTLEEQGLVERLSGDEDRRVVFVRPTAQGTALVQGAKQEFSRSLEEFMDYLGEEDGRELMRILRRALVFFDAQRNVQERNQEQCGN